MKCHHCKLVFSVSETMMVAHSASKKRFDIRPCKNIPTEYEQRYNNLFVSNHANSEERKSSEALEMNDIVEHQNNTILQYIECLGTKKNLP